MDKIVIRNLNQSTSDPTNSSSSSNVAVKTKMRYGNNGSVGSYIDDRSSIIATGIEGDDDDDELLFDNYYGKNN